MTRQYHAHGVHCVVARRRTARKRFIVLHLQLARTHGAPVDTREARTYPLTAGQPPARRFTPGFEEAHCWRDADVVGRHVVLRADGRDLPRVARRKARLQIPQPPIDRDVLPRALDEQTWRSPLDDHEIDLSTVRVAEVLEIEVSAPGVLLVMHPLEEMRRHEVFEPLRRLLGEGPVPVIVLLLLLHRPDPRRPEREAK